MSEPLLSRRVLALAGLLGSASGLFWLLSLNRWALTVLARLGFISAILSASALLILCWGLCVAYIGRKRNWSPRACYIAGSLLFFIPGSLIFFFGSHPFSGAAAILVCMSSLAGIACRKLAYPELTDEQASAPEPPLSMFPK